MKKSLIAVVLIAFSARTVCSANLALETLMSLAPAQAVYEADTDSGKKPHGPSTPHGEQPQHVISSQTVNPQHPEPVHPPHPKPMPPAPDPVNPPPHPGPVHPPHPEPMPPTPDPVNPPPPTPTPAEIDQAYKAGYNKGMNEGTAKGSMIGLSEGQIAGRQTGDSQGKWQGNSDGVSAGRRDGNRDGEAEGISQGRRDGRSKGTVDGQIAGQTRCYNEGYSTGDTEGYDAGYAEGGQSDSYRLGYDNGVADATSLEAQSGLKAGYKAGFAEREKQIRDSFGTAAKSSGAWYDKAFFEGSNHSLEAVRKGYSPEEAQAYKNGYDAGHNKGYKQAYKEAKDRGYRETYQQAYNEAYRFSYQNGYREGYANGKESAYTSAYQNEYNRSYNEYYVSYQSLEYAAERAGGKQAGYAEGYKRGYDAACTKLYQTGYSAGYDKTAAVVYPPAFESGKQTGMDSATKYYDENAVIEITGATLADETGNAVYNAGESVSMAAEVSNFGYIPSTSVACAITSSSKWIQLDTESASCGIVAARGKAVWDLKVGTISDDALLGATALIKLELKSGEVSIGFKTLKIQLANPKQRLGSINTDSVNVRSGPNSSIVEVLDKGASVVVTGKSGNWYRVVTPKGKNGYIYVTLVTVDWPVQP